nr:MULTISPECIES: zinc ribbon domain-containing protein [unclassified Rhodococcus (in: high G+C Gram-positive bacteria)]
MPTYTFRCSGGCEPTEEQHPMNHIPLEVPCHICSTSARRTISAPALGRGNTREMRLHDATRATAESPSTVRSLPGGGARRSSSTNPLHRKLPRP